jgi:hypothetical protein
VSAPHWKDHKSRCSPVHQPQISNKNIYLGGMAVHDQNQDSSEYLFHVSRLDHCWEYMQQLSKRVVWLKLVSEGHFLLIKHTNLGISNELMQFSIQYGDCLPSRAF